MAKGVLAARLKALQPDWKCRQATPVLSYLQFGYTPAPPKIRIVERPSIFCP